MSASAAAAAASAGRRCMNSSCGSPAPGGAAEWRKGWPLRAAGFAALCDKCGAAYDQLIFCDIFHQKESGWRECSYCGKRLHCGCIVSKYMFDLLDGGGVQCISCMKKSELQSMPSHPLPKFLLSQNSQRSLDKIDEPAGTGQINMVAKQRELENGIGQMKCEPPNLCLGDVAKMTNLSKNNSPIGLLQSNRRDENKNAATDNMANDSLSESCLKLGISHDANPKSLVEGPFLLSPTTSYGEGRDFSNALSPIHQMQKSRQFLMKSLKAEGADFDPSKDFLPCIRVARPPTEFRGRNQLLPRYWPRITEQELQQISGDANTTIVPLFEKVLSASDAGRIGRLVLPKACAEAYFPPISQPEGRPLTIQDARGKEWHFQFRFWPNNNSRMYVLEGVTPCIQSLQLQAGDTVTFSRIEPGGKLVMGYRKATNTVMLPDSQISALANGALLSKSFFSSVNDNLAIVNSSDGDFSWLKADNIRGKQDDDPLQLWQRRSRNIGSRSQRLLIDCEDSFELNMTWEEAQDLLRPSPTAVPSVVIIEDYEIEEYEEPPVFGKRTVFTIRSSGEQDQWIQCDDCTKWRRLPLHVIVASKWTCEENSWDQKHSSCSFPDELNPREVQSLIIQYEDMRRRRSNGSLKRSFEDLDSGLDALASAAVLGDAGPQAMSVAATTKHPRHRAGCTCIVCIQPPSGKGPKHSPSCTCNVCVTVRRRFTTLMMRKKQRHSEREEAEANKRSMWLSCSRDEPEGSRQTSEGFGRGAVALEKLDMNKGAIDLNFRPARDDGVQQPPTPAASTMNLLEAAVGKKPTESSYMKEQGSSSTATPATGAESEDRISNNEVRPASSDRDTGVAAASGDGEGEER